MKNYKIRELINKLNTATVAYDAGQPVMSDQEWDYLYFQLKELEIQSGILYPDSPTQTIHYEIVDKLEKVRHNHPLLSLDKTKDWDEFLSYFAIGKDVVGMLKLDGLTASLTYREGRLVEAHSRGNGEIGNDILHHVSVMSNVPKEIPYKEELIVDGEIICTYHDFENFKNEFANPRNMAAGSMSLLDAKESARRKLRFVAWYCAKGPWDKVLDSFHGLDNLGFEVVCWTSSFDWDAKEFLIENAERAGYPIDGLVGRYDDIKFGESLGMTGHHTRSAFAFKFYDETAETYLRQIEWSMGRSGQLTPVAIFDEVDLSGATLSRASLHNISVMKEIFGDYGPHIGQQISIFRANDVIPQVKEAMKYNNFTEANFYNEAAEEVANKILDGRKKLRLIIPDTCPFCGKPTEQRTENESTALYCTNPNCECQLTNRIEHTFSKKALDAKGISKATIEKLISWGWVESITDMFELSTHRTEWIKKPGFGAASVDKAINSIKDCSICTLDRFICSLGIPLIGTTASKELAKYFLTWENFIKAVEEKFDFSKLPNFGLEMTEQLLSYSYVEGQKIVERYITFSEMVAPASLGDSSLTGKKVAITGKIVRFKNRGELQTTIEQHGGKVVSSVTKATDYLVNNDSGSASSKNVSARNLGIPILTEDEFVEIFNLL